ncbi:MAG TPA: YdeI/OmpD-associated family protein [Thermoleophilia bacterium]|nr:YdeI/OmpD-associated family protein [Thermoleophilia bacterium]
MEAYRARPPYQQDDCVGWISRAKREEIRRRRLQQLLDELERGGGPWARVLPAPPAVPLLPYGGGDKSGLHAILLPAPLTPRRASRSGLLPGGPQAEVGSGRPEVDEAYGSAARGRNPVLVKEGTSSPGTTVASCRDGSGVDLWPEMEDHTFSCSAATSPALRRPASSAMRAATPYA